MDNITHTLIGIAVGETAIQVRAKRAQGFQSYLRPFYWLASIVGNNIPDSDVFLSPLLSLEKISNLLLHRGYTHTFIGALPQTLFFILGLWLYARAKKIFLPAKEWGFLFALTLFGITTHIFADSWNSYGVHPFWPWNGRWFYGDFIFIVEPWIWLTLLPPLYFTAGSKIWRSIFFLLFLIMLGLIWGTGFVILPIKILLSISAGIFLLTKTLPPLRRMAAAFTVLTSILGIFFLGRFYAESMVKKAFATKADSTIHDIIQSPYPANPLCWQTIVVETSGKDQSLYSLHLGVLATLPDAVNAQQCGTLRFKGSTAPLKNSSLSSNNEFFWLGVFQAPLQELKKMRQESCDAAALLKYLRAPFWILEGDRYILGDLRYDREKELGFTEIESTLRLESCPNFIPSWREPRADILGL